MLKREGNGISIRVPTRFIPWISWRASWKNELERWKLQAVVQIASPIPEWNVKSLLTVLSQKISGIAHRAAENTLFTTVTKLRATRIPERRIWSERRSCVSTIYKLDFFSKAVSQKLLARRAANDSKRFFTSTYLQNPLIKLKHWVISGYNESFYNEFQL